MGDDLLLNLSVAYRLHHGEVFEIVVCLEESVAGEELDQDASNTPDITRKRPAKIEDNLRCSVVARRHNGRMILVVKSGGTKINEADIWI